MNIEKLEEFAKDGDKNLDNLDVSQGFLQSEKPERQWFNKLLNMLTVKTNEVIDYTDGVIDDVASQKLDTGITATAKFENSVERSLSSKNAETISVADFYNPETDNGDWTSAFTKAGSLVGKKVFIPDNGTDYRVQGTIPTYCKFIGQGSPTIHLTVRGGVAGQAGDRGFWIKSEGGLGNLTIRREVVGLKADGNGAFNNGIIVGDYYNPTGEETKNWFIKNVDLIGIDERTEAGDVVGRTNIFGVIGNCHQGIIDNVKVNGYVSMGLMLHWGGEFDPADIHNSAVTKSWHPRNIMISNFDVDALQPDGGITGMLLSAVHNVSITNYTSRGVRTPLSITPGDVGGLVAQGESKELMMKNININGVTAYDYVTAGVQIYGRSKDRAGKVWYGADYELGINIDNLTIKRGANSTNNMLDIWFMSDVTINNLNLSNVAGQQSANEFPALYARYSRNINIKGRITAPFATHIQSCIGSTFDINDTCSRTDYNGYSNGTYMTCAQSTRTLTKAVSIGDKTIECDLTFFDVIKGGSVKVGTETMLITSATVRQATGSVVINIEPSRASAAIGDTVFVDMANDNIKLFGVSEKFRHGVYLFNENAGKSKNVRIAKTFRKCGNYDIYGRDVKALNVDGCIFEDGGQIDNDNCNNIRIIGASDDINIDKCTFEKNASGTTKIRENVYIFSSITNPTVTNSNFYLAQVNAIKYFTPTTNSEPPNFANNWYSSSIPDAFAVNDAAITTTVGGRAIGHATQIPVYGKWKRGDVLYNSNAAAGGAVGWICVASGTSGTWKTFGTVSA